MTDRQTTAAQPLSTERFLKACPHCFPKQDTLYPESGDFVAENGNKVGISCFGNQCGQTFKIQNCSTFRTKSSVFLRCPFTIKVLSHQQQIIVTGQLMFKLSSKL